MDLNLKDKVVIVTGASSGLGRATARMFAAEGASVALTYKTRETAGRSEAAEISSSYKVKTSAYHCDIASDDSIDSTFRRILSEFGGVDILVNNAAYWPGSFIKDMDPAQWRECLDINLTGHFIFSQTFCRHLIEQHSTGKIVNIVSFTGFVGSTTGHAHYASAKAGLISLTKSMAREMAQHEIHVNAVSPGMMYSSMTEETFSANEVEYIDRIPLKRIAQPEEVAHSVVFLASNRADYITGATLDVSGGLLMH